MYHDWLWVAAVCCGFRLYRDVVHSVSEVVTWTMGKYALITSVLDVTRLIWAV